MASVMVIFATRFFFPIFRLSCLSASIPLYLRGVDVSVEYLGLGLHVIVKRNFEFFFLLLNKIIIPSNYLVFIDVRIKVVVF